MPNHERAAGKKNVNDGHGPKSLESPREADFAGGWGQNQLLNYERAFYPSVERDVSLLTGARTYEAMSGLVLHLQQTRGNKYVQRLLENVTEDVQVSPAGSRLYRVPQPGIQTRPADRSSEVPGLRASTVARIKAKLEQATEASRQEGVDLMVDAMAGAGKVDLKRIEGKRVVYKPGLATGSGEYGHTSVTPGTGSHRPSVVTIGDGAVANASILYSTLMHEYQHVNRQWENKEESEAIEEVRAYLYEIEHMSESGLRRDAGQLSFLRRQLMAYWSLVEEGEQRAPYQRRYDKALKLIEARLSQIQTGR